MSQNPEDYKNFYIPVGAFALTLAFFIFPFKCFRGRKNQDNELSQQMNFGEENDYEAKAVNFNEDYLRNNPLLAKEGWKNWLNLIEKKKGIEEKRRMEERFSNVMHAAENPRNYAYQHRDIENGGLGPIIANPLANVLNTINQNIAQFQYLNMSIGQSANLDGHPSDAMRYPRVSSDKLYEHYYN